ncbi:MAG: hypothetical protein ACREFP_11925 [Acetobacteraceae bacterium]
MPLGVVVGLAAEARIARPLRAIVTIGGGTPQGAEIAAESLAAGGATGLLSFGLAGGLDPALRPGDLLVPRAVRAFGQDWPADPTLLQLLGGPTIPLLLSEGTIVASAVAKRRLWQASGAAAVDLESGAVAEAAIRHDLPFAVLRAVCDPASRSLPRAALVALDAAGRVRPLRFIRVALARPGQLAALLALASDAAHARRTLAERVSVLCALGPSPVLGDKR